MGEWVVVFKKQPEMASVCRYIRERLEGLREQATWRFGKNVLGRRNNQCKGRKPCRLWSVAEKTRRWCSWSRISVGKSGQDHAER